MLLKGRKGIRRLASFQLVTVDTHSLVAGVRKLAYESAVLSENTKNRGAHSACARPHAVW